MQIRDLDSPALLVDPDTLDRNIAAMQGHADSIGAHLRPHIKTHKSLAVARRQVAAGARGLTCAKLSEAEVMCAASRDLFVAYPPIGAPKFERLERLVERAAIRVSVESIEGARLLADHVKARGRSQPVMVKCETGLLRTGVSAAEMRSFLEQVARLKHLELVGLFTHEGLAYRKHGRAELRALVVDVVEKLHGMKADFVSVFGREPEISPGCSLTAKLLERGDGVTEMRPGTYAYADTYSVASGVYGMEECAFTVLVRIVAVKSDGRVVVDGGSKTFALDRHSGLGHGMVVDHPDLLFDRLSEEHGVMQTDHPERYRIGDFLEVIPAHVCPVVNLHSRLFVRKGEEVVDEWPIDARGCVW